MIDGPRLIERGFPLMQASPAFPLPTIGRGRAEGVGEGPK